MSGARVYIPDWMRAGPGAGISPNGRARRTSVVERTIAGLSEALRRGVFAEQIAARPGLMQATDARVKTAGTVALLIVTGLSRNPLILLGLYLATVQLARLSLISTAYFIKRVWLFIPIFAGIVFIPSMFNVVKEGDALVTLWDFGREVRLGPWSLGDSLAITTQGVAGAVLFILRVATSVSLAVLLTLTTRWSELLKALRVFYVPRLFVLILSLTYRYIFLLLDLSLDMFTARRSRMVGRAGPREDRRFITGSMGTLLGKSQTLSDEVYAAMVSRGYNGEPRTLSRFSWRGADWAFAAGVAALAAAALGGERLLG